MSMPQKLTIPFSIVGLAGFVWVCAAAFGGKADKSEVQQLREQVASMDKGHALSVQEQKQMFELIKEIRNDQKWMLQEMWKELNSGSRRPPASTPSPNPLNNRDDR